jgi:predicted Zn-dependent protease
MSSDHKTKTKKLILAGIGCVMFASSASTSLLGLLKSSASQQSVSKAVISQADQLKQDAKAYESILLREPNNRIALEGIVKVRVTQQDLAGAKKHLKKLIALEPNNKSFQSLMDELQKPNAK